MDTSKNTLNLQEMAITHKSKTYWKNKIWDYEKEMPDLARAQNQFLINLVYPLLNKNMHICELACSDGTYTRKFASHVKGIDAYDLSEKIIALAKEKTKEAGITNISYFCEDLAKKYINENHYDSMVILGLFTYIINDFTMKTIVEKAVNSIPSGAYIILKDTLSNEETFIYETDDYAGIYRSSSDYMHFFEEHGLTMVDKHILIRSERTYSLWCILKKP